MTDDLPMGWVETELGEIAQIIGGSTPTNSSDTSNFEYNGIPWITPSDLTGYEETYISRGRRDLSQKGFASCGTKKLPKGSVLFSSRAPIGYCVIANNEVCTNQGFKSFVPFEGIIPEFLRYYLITSKSYIDSVASGTTFKEISASRIATVPFSLPPLNEQRRIVDKLDRIGDRNRLARNELNHIPKLIARYKQSVLAAACSGKLTEDWREINDCKTWEITTLDAVANIVDPHPSHRTPKEFPDGIPYVGIGDIDSSGSFDFLNARKVSPDILKEHQERYTLNKGDFVFGKIGTLGNVTPLPLGIEYTLSANVILIQPKISFVEPSYLMFFLQSPQTMKEITNQSSSTSQAAFGIKKMRAFQFLMPDLQEQKEIVKRVEKMFEKIDMMEQEYQKAAKLCDRLEQATLAKAFRGELVPQDPDDEPASVLLEQVKREKEKGKKVRM